MAQDIEGLIPDGAKKDLEQIDDLWADILSKTIAYVDTVSKLNNTSGVDRTLSSLEDNVHSLSDAYKQYVKGLDDVTAAQKRAADAALKAAKAKTEESRQALNNAKAQKEEAKAHETTSKSKDRAAKESAKIDAAKRKELQALINDTKKAFTEIDKIQKQYQDNQKKYGAEEIKRQAKEENWSYAQRVASLKAFVAEQKKIVAESNNRIKAIDREIAALDKETNKELDAIRKKNTAYNILNDTHKRLKIDAQNAGAEFGVESKQFKEAAAAANALDKKLKDIDSQLGDHRRNVGNYASAWQGLNRSIGIVLTELPNMGLSWRTFAISISNNIGQVVEDMRTMVAANRAAAAAGLATIPVWKQVASAIFSWRTLMYIGIAVFTAMSAQAGEATDKIKIFTKESDALKDVNTRISDSWAKQSAELRILKERFFDATASVEQKQDVLRELNKKYSDTIGKINSINEAEKFFIERSDAYVEALLTRAQIEGAYDAIAENSKKVLAQQAKDAEEATNIWVKFSTYLYSFDKANPLFKKGGDKLWVAEYEKGLEAVRKRLLANTENDAAKSNAIIETFIQNQIKKLNELSKKFGFGFDQDPETPKGPKETDLTNTEITVQERINKAKAERRKVELEDIKNHQQLIFDNEQNWYSERIAALNLYNQADKALNSIALNTELADLQVNLDKIEDIEAKDARKRTAQEKRLLAQKEAFKAEYDAIVAKYTIKENDIVAAGAQKNLEIFKQEMQQMSTAAADGFDKLEEYYTRSAEERISKEGLTGKRADAVRRQALRNALNDAQEYLSEISKVEGVSKEAIDKISEGVTKLFKAVNKGATKEIKDILKEIAGTANHYIDGIQSLIQAFGSDTSEIDAQISGLERVRDVKIAAIQAERISEEEKNKKIAQAEFELYSKREALEARKRAMLNKQAIAEKAAAIFRVIINTAVEVSENLGNPFLAAAIGFAGAAQVAAISATPVPQYKYGTDDHPGGFAILGDGGKREPFITDNGRLGISPNVPTLFDLPAHTQVFPDVDQLFNMMPFLGPSLINSIRPGKTVDISPAIEKQTRALNFRLDQTNALLRKATAKENTSIIGRGMAQYYYQKNSKL